MDIDVRASFDTRRNAELAVEHLVQKHGLNRTDIFVEADGAANSAGTVRSGADAQSSLAEPRDSVRPRLGGAIHVSVGCPEQHRDAIQAALRQAGAIEVR